MKATGRAILAAAIVLAAAVLCTCIIPGASSVNESEPNDSTVSPTGLGTLGSKTVYGEFSGSDTTDCFHFSKGSESTIEMEIIAANESLEYDIDYVLEGGASPLYGYQAEYRSISGQSSYHDYDLTLTINSYSDGGRYIIIIRCY